MFFLGEYAHSLDEKGRLTIPVKYRDALGSRPIIARGFDKNLHIYTAEHFQKLASRVGSFSPTSEDNRALSRTFFSYAYEAELDKAGRIIIPQPLRDYAGLNGDVSVVGVGAYVEVWSQEDWEALRRSLDDPNSSATRFDAINLSTD